MDRLLGDTREPYYGAFWLESAMRRKGLTVGRLGARVAALLNAWAFGIYHLDTPNPKKWTFDQEDWVEFTFSHSMATFDGDELTRLVLLAHDFQLRVEVSAVAPRRFRLFFSRREREGRLFARHPTIESALAEHRKHWPKAEAAS